MKTRIVNEEAKKEPEFPALYRSIEHGYVVLMSSKGKGLSLTGFGPHKVGDFSADWAMDCFERMSGKVTIEFEV